MKKTKTFVILLAALFSTVSVQAQLPIPGISVNTTQANNSLSTSGNAINGGGNIAVGSGYCGIAAPWYGMIVQGKSGFGNPFPDPWAQVDVSGNLKVTGLAMLGGTIYPIGFGSPGMVLTTDGIGNASWAYTLPKTYTSEGYLVFDSTANSFGGSFGNNTTSLVSVTGLALLLTPGTYNITASAQVGNDPGTGTRVTLTDGTNYFGTSIRQSNYFDSWTSGTIRVTITANTTYSVKIASTVPGPMAYIRNTTINAEKVQQ